MLGKLFFFALCAACAFTEESSIDVQSDLAALKKVTDEGMKKVGESVAKMEAAPGEYDKLVEERVGCLEWEYTAQKIAINKTIAEAVLKGMMKNKPFDKFQCITQAAREVFQKLDAIGPQIPGLSDKIKEKSIATVRQIALLMPAFHSYWKDMYKEKSGELKKGNDEARSKIMKEVAEKMNFFTSILKQVDEFVKNTGHKFFEEHIHFAHDTENNLKKTQREGAQKILKCVN